MRRSFQRDVLVLATVTVVELLILYALPLAKIVASSLTTSTTLGAPREWIGNGNFIRCLHDSVYSQAFIASLAFAVPSVLCQVTIATCAALLTHRDSPGAAFFRWLLVIPYFLPSVVVVVAWRFFSDPFVGPLPEAIRSIGLVAPDFRGPGAALPVMILVSTYEAFPFAYLVLLTRLQQTPPSRYEVAAVHGANTWLEFVTVTWPEIRVTFFTLLLLRLFITWLKFDVPWLVYASQAPSPWGDTAAVAMYRTAFESLDPGKASAFSVLALGAVGLLVGLIACRPHRRTSSAAI